jgi:hypothetical protein
MELLGSFQQDEPYYSSSKRPVQVGLCLQAAQKGDLEGVKEQTEQLLRSSDVSPRELKPKPGWLYDSLSAAIKQKDRKVVEYLLEQNVHDGEFPAETAVRAGAFDILALFLDHKWEINKPNRDEPPVLWYNSYIYPCSFRTYSCLGSPCLARLTRKWPAGCSTTALILTAPATWT